MSAWLALVLAVVGGTNLRAVSAENEGASPTAQTTRSSPSVETILASLATALRDLDENLHAQDGAWPRRAEDQLNEQEPPLIVRTLQSKEQQIRERVDALGRELQSSRAEDLDALVEALEKNPRDEMFRTLLPVIHRLGKRSPAVLAMLARQARAADPCPRELVDALVARDEPAADETLFSLGRSRANAWLLAASCASGRRTSLERLLDLAESRRSEERALGIEALARLRLSPTPRPELAELLLSRSESTRIEDLRPTLVATLGLVATDHQRIPLEVLASSGADLPTRLAAIGALGRLGGESTRVLLDTLREDAEVSVRSACAHALASTRDRRAIPILLDLIDDPRLGSDALLALERIANTRQGATRGAWLRWWRRQPESGVRDPDLEAASL